MTHEDEDFIVYLYETNAHPNDNDLRDMYVAIVERRHSELNQSGANDDTTMDEEGSVDNNSIQSIESLDLRVDDGSPDDLYNPSTKDTRCLDNGNGKANHYCGLVYCSSLKSPLECLCRAL